MLEKKIAGYRYITHCFKLHSTEEDPQNVSWIRRTDNGRTFMYQVIQFPCFFRDSWPYRCCESSKLCIRPIRASAKSMCSSQVIEYFTSCTVCTRFAAERTRFYSIPTAIAFEARLLFFVI